LTQFAVQQQFNTQKQESRNVQVQAVGVRATRSHRFGVDNGQYLLEAIQGYWMVLPKKRHFF
jgi:hypothetical protein